MNRLEANISLLAITFFASVQYVFLAAVPEDISHFAFLCVTNLVGFLMTFAFFFGELFRLDVNQIKQSAILSAELVVFNLFMLIGVSGISPTVTASVISSFFVFIVIINLFLTKTAPDKFTLAGVLVVLAGLFFMTDADINGLLNVNILYLLVADIAFACYTITVGSYAASSNPSILAMGQMFFCFIFSLILWACDAIFFGASFSLPTNREFWGSVIYISFFIRGLYGVVQIYAQRYTSPLNTALIFSTEIVMTMALSPLLTKFFGTSEESITPLRILGSVLILAGLMAAEPEFVKFIGRFFHAKNAE